MYKKSLAGKSGHSFQQTKKKFWTIPNEVVRIKALDKLVSAKAEAVAGLTISGSC